MANNTEKNCEFSAAVRGYHYYRSVWLPQESEVLECHHDFGNVFDMFAIKTCKSSGEIVGHLPREISRVTKFLLDRGAIVQAILTSTDYRRSPLVQGGLEISCRMVVRERLKITCSWTDIWNLSPHLIANPRMRLLLVLSCS